MCVAEKKRAPWFQQGIKVDLCISAKPNFLRGTRIFRITSLAQSLGAGIHSSARYCYHPPLPSSYTYAYGAFYSQLSHFLIMACSSSPCQELFIDSWTHMQTAEAQTREWMEVSKALSPCANAISNTALRERNELIVLFCVHSSLAVFLL